MIADDFRRGPADQDQHGQHQPGVLRPVGGSRVVVADHGQHGGHGEEGIVLAADLRSRDQRLVQRPPGSRALEDLPVRGHDAQPHVGGHQGAHQRADVDVRGAPAEDLHEREGEGHQDQVAERDQRRLESGERRDPEQVVDDPGESQKADRHAERGGRAQAAHADAAPAQVVDDPEQRQPRQPGGERLPAEPVQPLGRSGLLAHRVEGAAVDDRDPGDLVAQAAAQRSRLLRTVARLIERDRDRLARAEALDGGKPVALASSVEVPRAAQNFEFFADAVTQWHSEAHATDEVALNYTLRQPLGVVGCISPWNLPLYLLTWKVAPALAAGNCVVAKPSEVTPMTAHMLGELCGEAGLPPGVLNIVQGLGPRAGSALVSHADVRAVSFTGSTRVGREIAARAAERFTKISLEMGGRNPSVIFADADLAEAVPEAARAAFQNQGQICLCGSRILVERPAYEEVKERLVAAARALRIGDPLDPATEQGSLVSQQHFQKVMGCLELAKEEGGRVLCGGKRARLDGRCRGGWFVEPTVIEGLGTAWPPRSGPGTSPGLTAWRRGSIPASSG